MTITNMDPEEIKEIIETDTVRTAVISAKAVDKYKYQLDDCTVIKVEGMELRLNGFDELRKEDGSREAVMYLKVNPELGQLQYAVSDHEDAGQVQQEIFPTS